MSPWMRLDDGAMTCLKIMRLSDSAFRLWIKGLCYCQQHLTDGRIPREMLPQFEAKPKDVIALTTSQVVDKAPLWEVLDGFGFQVHDFLDWNESRDEVQRKREASKLRVKKSRGSASVAALHTPHSASGGDRDLVLEEVQEKPAPLHHPRPFPGRKHNPGVLGAAIPREHGRHALCGRVCLPAAKYEQFVRKIGGDDIATAERTVLDWAKGVLAAWERSPLLSLSIQGNDFEFWDARYEEWQGAAVKSTPKPHEPRSTIPNADETRRRYLS